MRFELRFCAAIALVTVFHSQAQADDGLAAFQNGALVFGKSDTIVMKSEVLTITRDLITADFIFVNTGSKSETVTIAFPLPDVAIGESDGMYFPVEDNDNFVGFTTEVDGKTIDQGLEQRAFAPDGREVTAELKGANVPLVRQYFAYLDLFPTLPQDVRNKLVASGAALGEAGDITPQWTTKSKFHFEQTFQPGKDVHIVHRYKPSLDTSNMSFYSGDMTPSEDQIKLFCTTDTTKDAVVALEKAKASSKDPDECPYAIQLWLRYILATARTWSGPIGSFHLIVETDKPETVVSSCQTLKRTSPTRLEFEAKDYVPAGDLDIVMFQ